MQYLPFFFFITAFSLIQHQDVESHMSPDEHQIISCKMPILEEADVKVGEWNDAGFIEMPQNITYNRTSL